MYLFETTTWHVRPTLTLSGTGNYTCHLQSKLHGKDLIPMHQSNEIRLIDAQDNSFMT